MTIYSITICISIQINQTFESHFVQKDKAYLSFKELNLVEEKDLQTNGCIWCNYYIVESVSLLASLQKVGFMYVPLTFKKCILWYYLLFSAFKNYSKLAFINSHWLIKLWWCPTEITVSCLISPPLLVIFKLQMSWLWQTISPNCQFLVFS